MGPVVSVRDPRKQPLTGSSIYGIRVNGFRWPGRFRGAPVSRRNRSWMAGSRNTGPSAANVDRLHLVLNGNSPSTRDQRLYRRQPATATGSLVDADATTATVQ